MKYVVTGKAVLTIGIVVDAESQEEAFEKADGQFGGLRLVGRKKYGTSAVGVAKINEFVGMDYEREFDEACTLEEYEELHKDEEV